jgi:NAD(P)-dependent dehydrogenase (short-subunit alcohol dehydrogenase family)
LVTGGTGALGGAIALGLAQAGADVAVLGRRGARAAEVKAVITRAGGRAETLVADVLDRDQLQAARRQLMERFGGLDILVNAAGGNQAAATTGDSVSFFDLPEAALRAVIDLNLLGTLLPCQVFAEPMAEHGEGVIVNISSMASQRALTRVVGYGAAKAGVESLTRWLAVELARRYGPGLRVNAIAPSFFATEQNRSLLFSDEDQPTPRTQAILEHTPAGRLGQPVDLIGAVVWLCGPSAAFVNGAVVPVDGGFGAFSGV